MELITKNKIFDYIEQYPEAKTALLIWAKEFEIDTSSISVKKKKFPERTIGIGYGEYNLFDNFRLRLCTNYWLKTAILTWFGTKQELSVYTDQQMKKLRELHPDLTTKIVTINSKGRKIYNKDRSDFKEASVFVNPDLLIDKHLEKIPSQTTSHLYTKKEIETKYQYQNALSVAVDIFKAQPDTNEFKELSLLLPLIKSYEKLNFVFPTLDPLDVIRLKLKERNMVPQDLTRLIGNEEDVNLIFSDRKPLSKGIIGKLCRRLKITL